MKGSDLVTVRVQGGLGNQLFQAAAAYYVSRLNYQDRMTLDVSRIPFGTDPTRRFEIEQFDLFPPDFHTSIEGEAIAKFAYNFSQKFGSLVIRGFSWSQNFLSSKENLLFYDDKSVRSLESLKAETTLYGYFNNFEIVSRAESSGFSRELKPKFELPRWLCDYINSSDFENSVALHIRLGDYLKFPHIFGHLSEDFYLDCLEKLKVESYDNIVIFSDQPNKVANLVPKISSRPRTHIFREPLGATSYETFYLMSQFKKIACANSTFSMWAAWFNDFHGDSKKVTVPSPYLLTEEDMKTPGSWIKVSRAQ